jgi:hypothetical protein
MITKQGKQITEKITSPVKHAQESREKLSSLLMVDHIKNVTARYQSGVRINNP